MNILQVLEHISRDRKLPFLVIGGHAVAASGYPRTTGDLDILVQKEQRLEWIDALKALGYDSVSDQTNFAQLRRQPWDWPVDLMFVNSQTFTKMWDARVTTRITDVAVGIPAPEHLVALKLHALRHGRAHRLRKDMDDIIELITANRLRDKLPELCDRYGTSELYERIRIALGESGS